MKNKVLVLFLDNLYVLFPKLRVISSGSYESDCVDNCHKLVMVVANAIKIFFQPS